MTTHDPDSPVSTADETELEPSAGEAEGKEGAEEAKPKLKLEVQIKDVGPCRKHVEVSISPDQVAEKFAESLGEMQREAKVPGFRPGHAPRSLIEKRFRKQVADQVKSNLLMAALEQLDKDYDLNPISQPKLDLEAITLPEGGPLRFEMEIEVRPEFALPTYKGMSVNRPVKTLTDADVDAQMTSFLERHGQMVPKLTGGAEMGDFVTADMVFQRDGVVGNVVKEAQFRLQRDLQFQDGVAHNVGTLLAGVKPGESREGEVSVGSGSPDPSMRGQSVGVTFHVKDLKQMRLPEVNAQFLASIGFENKQELREALKEILERRLATQQRQAMRREIMDKLMAETSFELPPDLVARQERTTIQRLVMEMRQGGLNDDEIRAREAQIKANARESTQRGIREFFILARIAEAEDIEVQDEDMANEIELMAARSDESARRVRARIEKEGLGEALASQILERKTLDRILEFVQSTEVPLVEEALTTSTLDETATTAPPEAEAEASSEGEAAAEAKGGETASAEGPGPGDEPSET
jgi:trigger factor